MQSLPPTTYTEWGVEHVTTGDVYPCSTRRLARESAKADSRTSEVRVVRREVTFTDWVKA